MRKKIYLSIWVITILGISLWNGTREAWAANPEENDSLYRRVTLDAFPSGSVPTAGGVLPPADTEYKKGMYFYVAEPTGPSDPVYTSRMDQALDLIVRKTKLRLTA